MIKVLRADKSPLNKKQWLCELECGHEQWVTSTRKPTKAHCYECDFPTMKDAEQNAHLTLGESAPSQTVFNAEAVSTSDSVPPPSPTRTAIRGQDARR